MLVGGYRVDAAHGDVVAENPVQFINGLFGILQGLTGIKMGDVKGGMYPRIRPSGTDHLNLFPQQRTQSPVQDFLDSRGTRLYLPAVVIPAVVC